MLTGQKEQTGKKNSGKVIVGYDLGIVASQISYYQSDTATVETVSCVAGTEQYNIPTVLCKRKGVNQWFYGKEALKYAASGEGILVENLLILAERGEDVVVEEESYNPIALLTLFVKRSLTLFTMQIPLNRIEALMFTVEDLTPHMVDVLSKIAAGLRLKTQNIYFQSHMESFYHYVLYQPKELWKNNVLIFDYSTQLKSMQLECNKRTTPQVVFIRSREFPSIERVSFSDEERESREQKNRLDEIFLQVVEEETAGNMISTVYLLGDGFKEGWASKSLRALCRNRRVFQGNNLYSKGACYGGLERREPGVEGKSHVYLGKDKLKANIGMKVLRRGQDSYFAILDAGSNWYEVFADFEVIPESGNVIDFLITPLTGGNVIDRQIVLEGLPERPPRATRLRIHMEMSAADQAVITIEDLGFGELFPSSGKAWTHTINLTENR